MHHHVRTACLLGALAATSCFDSGTRWEGPGPTAQAPPAPPCAKGDQRCDLGTIQTCKEGAGGVLAWANGEDCASKGLVCGSNASGVYACTACVPNAITCQGQEVMTCLPDGSAAQLTDTCDITNGNACRQGSCQDLCALAAIERSNVG